MILIFIIKHKVICEFVLKKGFYEKSRTSDG